MVRLSVNLVIWLVYFWGCYKKNPINHFFPFVLYRRCPLKKKLHNNLNLLLDVLQVGKLELLDCWMLVSKWVLPIIMTYDRTFQLCTDKSYLLLSAAPAENFPFCTIDKNENKCSFSDSEYNWCWWLLQKWNISFKEFYSCRVVLDGCCLPIPQCELNLLRWSILLSCWLMCFYLKFSCP